MSSSCSQILDQSGIITLPIYGIPQTFVSDISDSETEPSISQISYDSEFEYECGFLTEPIHFTDFTKKNHVSHKTINSTNKINGNSNIYSSDIDHDVNHRTYASCDVNAQNVNFNISNHCEKNKEKINCKSSVDSRYHNNNKNVQKFNLVYTKFDANTINTDINNQISSTEKQSTSCRL